MARALPCILLVVGLVHAQQESYEAVIQKALLAERERAPGQPPDEPLDKGYETTWRRRETNTSKGRCSPPTATSA
jgi:hypothetical protein